MKSMTVILVPLLLIACAAVFAFAKDSDGIPSGIKMLPGYSHEQLRGVDTRVGKMSRKDGFTIRYDIGKSAGNYASEQKNEAAWFKEQAFHGQSVQVAFSKTKELTVTFTNGPANFYATVKNEEDMADVYLTALTYSPKGP